MNIENKIEPPRIHKSQKKTRSAFANLEEQDSGKNSEFPTDNLGEVQSLVENMSEGYALLKVIPNESSNAFDYRIASVNSAFITIIGETAQTLFNRNIPTIFPRETRTWIENLEEVRITGKAINFKVTHGNKGGVFEVLAYRKSEHEVVTLFTDISEIETLKREIQKTHKLRSIGLLAGGIAHDFNNILTGVLGNISLIKLYFNSDQKVSRIISDAEFSAKRAQSLIHQLLTFSEMGENVGSPLSMSELLKDTISFVLSGSGVRSQIEIPENLWTCKIDEGQFYQIINNLVTNAIEAIEDEENIGITAHNFAVNDGGHSTLKEGFYIKISINDQGKGIPDTEFDEIFTPYFTTKVNRLGLGLPIVKSIVDNAGGFISLKSHPGVGSTFSVYIPAIPNEEKSELTCRTSTPALSGKGRILVMDDEKIIRNFVGTTLQKAGYQVVLTNSGSETVDVFKKEIKAGKIFDALILDLTIPGDLGGKEILEDLSTIDPDVKAVVSSGYYNDPVVKNYKDFGFQGVLIKPYDIQEICKVLHNVIHNVI